MTSLNNDCDLVSRHPSHLFAMVDRDGQKMVAQDIVDKCKLISQSKHGVVVECLEALLQRVGGKSPEGVDDWEAQWNAQRRSALDRYVGESQVSLTPASCEEALKELVRSRWMG